MSNTYNPMSGDMQDTAHTRTRIALHHLAVELVQRDNELAAVRAELLTVHKDLALMRSHNLAQSAQLARTQGDLEHRRRIYDEVHAKWCAESAESAALRLKLEAHMARRKKRK